MPCSACQLTRRLCQCTHCKEWKCDACCASVCETHITCSACHKVLWEGDNTISHMRPCAMASRERTAAEELRIVL